MKQTLASRDPEVHEVHDLAFLAAAASTVGMKEPAHQRWTWRKVAKLSRLLSDVIGADFDAVAVLSASMQAMPGVSFSQALVHLDGCASARGHAARLGIEMGIEPHAFHRTTVRMGGRVFTVPITRLAAVLSSMPSDSPASIVLGKILEDAEQGVQHG